MKQHYSPIFIIILCIMILPLCLSSQANSLQEKLSNVDVFKKYDLIDLESHKSVNKSFGSYDNVSIRKEKLQSLVEEKPESIAMTFEYQDSKKQTLELVLNPHMDYRLKDAESGEELEYTHGSHYIGRVKGESNSIVALSVYPDQIDALIHNNQKTYTIAKTKGSNQHVIYKKDDLEIPFEFNCSTKMEEHTVKSDDNDIRSSGNPDNCVKMYVEVEHEYANQFETYEEANTFMASLFNQVSALYAQEDINLALATLVIWNTPDPYDGSPLNKLSTFRSNLSGDFEGNLAHLIGFGSGGVGYVNVVCNKSFGVGYSGISTFHLDIPTYSWSVEVVTHEIGHNLGSQHTHACAWNGNNTAIDGCGPSIGYNEGCNAPIPTQGTIMSYCHLVNGIGIDFNLGFGQQPGDRIRSRVHNATCLETCGGCPNIGEVCDDNDPCTINDLIDTNCDCTGTYTDTDNDGYCIGDDPDDLDDCIPVAHGSNCEITCTDLNFSNFEDGSTFWNIGGLDAAMVYSSNAYSPTRCIRLRDNSGKSSSIISNNINALQASGIEVDLYLYPYSMEPGERFLIEYSTDGGQTFTPSLTLKSNTEFHNGNLTHVNHTIEGMFSSSTQIRLRCDASSNGDQLFLDDINVKLCSGSSQADCVLTGQPCDDLNQCTVGETYDADCDCNGGTYVDNDNDNYCIGIDPNDNDPCIPNDADCVNCDVTGMPCNDNNGCTTGETFDEDCNCNGGVYTDADSDGYCIGIDPNDNDPCVPNDSGCSNCDLEGQACDDGDSCTIGDYYNSDCNCISGVVIDSDQDGFCLTEDPNDNDPCIPVSSGSGCDSADCVTISNDTFLEDWGIWNDGGSDCARVLSSISHSDTYSIKVRDDSGIQSSMYTDILPLSGYTSVEIQFVFYAVSMENNKKVILEYSTNGGNTYQTAKEWIAGINFENSQYIYAQHSLENLIFTNQMRFRIQCVGSNNADQVYIDDVEIQACGIGVNDTPELSYLADEDNLNERVKTVVYPNPVFTGQLLYVGLPNNSKEYIVEIFDLYGNRKYSSLIEADVNQISIDVSKYPPGNYFISVANEDLKEVEQLVILN